MILSLIRIKRVGSYPLIQKERIQRLNNKPLNEEGKYVLYWMQAAQRAHYNHALEYAIKQANSLDLPLVVFFGLTDDFPDANLRHYKFMLEGLAETKQTLEDRGIQMLVEKTEPPKGILSLSSNSSLTVVDRGYLRIEREWRKRVSNNINCPLIEIETDVVVPVEQASNKEEYAAYTIRPKINDQLQNYLVEVEHHTPNQSSLDLDLKTSLVNLSQQETILKNLKVDRSVKPVDSFTGRHSKALENLEDFLENKLDDFPDKRNDPGENYLSNLGPYLHFGQISPLEIALKVIDTKSPGVDPYLEELIVRRELSFNFVFYNSHYDDLWRAIPEWAAETLKTHQEDSREYLYGSEEFENAETHDPYWNAAQNEMRFTGKMYGYMRMYWVKKILEWSETPKEAFETALKLNNKYELDERDPNGFAGVAWCFGKHDRAWKERPVLGKVRYMSSGGSERKFAIKDYVKKIEQFSQPGV